VQDSSFTVDCPFTVQVAQVNKQVAIGDFDPTMR
jgi:hypothetical protein